MRKRPSRTSHLLAVLLAASSACDRNPFDPAQQPRVTATSALPVVISWQPAGAQLVRVYRGAVAGDGYTANLMWSAAASGRNSLVCGIQYGASPPPGGTTDVAAKPLVSGETYTVQVTRQDPKGTGDGFTNTGNRYVGTATFTLAAQ